MKYHEYLKQHRNKSMHISVSIGGRQVTLGQRNWIMGKLSFIGHNINQRKLGLHFLFKTHWHHLWSIS